MKIKDILILTRAHWSVSSTSASIIGVSLAWKDGFEDITLSILVIFSTFISHIFMEIWDEISDYIGYRRDFYNNSKQELGVLSGGSGILTNNLMTLKQTIGVFSFFLIIYLFIILFILNLTNWHIVYFGIFGFFLLFGYSNFIKLSYRGLGEIANLITFGPLILCGSYAAIVAKYSFDIITYKELVKAVLNLDIGTVFIDFIDFIKVVSIEALIISIVFGIIWFAGIHISEVYDYSEDKFANKRTLVVRFGTSYGMKMQFISICLIPIFVIYLVSINISYLLLFIPLTGLILNSFQFLQKFKLNRLDSKEKNELFVFRSFIYISLTIFSIIMLNGWQEYKNYYHILVFSFLYIFLKIPAFIFLRNNK